MNIRLIVDSTNPSSRETDAIFKRINSSDILPLVITRYVKADPSRFDDLPALDMNGVMASGKDLDASLDSLSLHGAGMARLEQQVRQLSRRVLDLEEQLSAPSSSSSSALRAQVNASHLAKVIPRFVSAGSEGLSMNESSIVVEAIEI